MKVGWAYLALSVIAVLVGAYMAVIQGSVFGDVVLFISIPLIYLGSTSLAETDAAEELTQNAHGDSSESSADEGDDASATITDEAADAPENTSDEGDDASESPADETDSASATTTDEA
ncbi:MAG: hypothetical protein ABEH60_01245, partial [Halonotius sp.]